MKEGQVENILHAMQNKGIKRTTPRVAVVRLLAASRQPLSAEEITQKVDADINRVTVYRTLTTLEHAGYIARFTFQNKHVYELATQHSHYLVCRDCDAVERLSACTLRDIEKETLKKSKRFASIDQHTLQLQGVCKKCR